MRQTALFLATLLTLGPPPSAARADTVFLSQVATCTGRLSALLEQHWETDDPREAETRKIHAHMTDLLFAVVTPDTERDARGMRSDAKLRFRALLQRLPDGEPESRADRMARDKALRDIRNCASMILSRSEVEAWLVTDHNSATTISAEPVRASSLHVLDSEIK